jgi:hypothetical protein
MNKKYFLLIPLGFIILYFLYNKYNQKNMEINLLDEKDIKNQINVQLSDEDKYLGQIAQPYPKDLQPKK